MNIYNFYNSPYFYRFKTLIALQAYVAASTYIWFKFLLEQKYLWGNQGNLLKEFPRYFEVLLLVEFLPYFQLCLQFQHFQILLQHSMMNCMLVDIPKIKLWWIFMLQLGFYWLPKLLCMERMNMYCRMA